MDKKPEEVTNPQSVDTGTSKPATQPQPSAESSSAQMPAEQSLPPVMGSKKSKTGLIVGIVVAVIAVAAASGIGIWLYIINTPDYLLKSAVESMSKTSSVAGTFSVTNGVGAGATTINGDVAVKTDPANTKNGEVILGIGADNSRVGVTVLTANDELYIKASGLDHISSLMKSFSAEPEIVAQYNTAEVKSFLREFNDQWYVLTADEIQSLAASGDLTTSGNINPGEIKTVLSIYQKHIFIKSDKTYSDEKINGVNSAHFSIKVDHAEYIAFLQAVKDANLKTFQITQKDLDAEKAKTTGLSDSTVEFWIGRDKKEFTQINLTNTKKGEESKVSFTFATSSVKFDDFTKPSNTKPLTELFSELMGGSSSSPINQLEKTTPGKNITQLLTAAVKGKKATTSLR